MFSVLYLANSNGNHIQDGYRIVIFERPEHFEDDISPQTHVTLVDGPCRPSDRFLRMHFEQCLAVSACLGDVREDYYEQDIEIFMDDLGVCDDEIDYTDPRWESPLGKEVYSYLLRQKLAGYVLPIL